MASKSNQNGALDDWARAPPKHGSCGERVAKIFYNPDDNSCFGRTPKRWVIVFLFYGIFYAVLAAMFTACMAGLMYNIEEDKPYYMLHESLIGGNPGVTYRPLPNDGFLMKYHASDNNDTQSYIKQLNDFFQDYQNEKWYSDQKVCTAEDDFGYPNTPCFFIKVNKIYSWKPEYYEASNLPADMSEDLKQTIAELKPEEQTQVWVSCWDEHGNSTSFEYPWGHGLPARFFPYTKQDGYRSPLVAVKFMPQAGTLSTIRCRAWAKNIIYNKSIKEASGYARIQLQVTYNATEEPATKLPR